MAIAGDFIPGMMNFPDAKTSGVAGKPDVCPVWTAIPGNFAEWLTRQWCLRVFLILCVKEPLSTMFGSPAAPIHERGDFRFAAVNLWNLREDRSAEACVPAGLEGNCRSLPPARM